MKQPGRLVWVERVKGSGEHFRLNDMEYLVRYTGDSAYHILQNYMGGDERHRIHHREITALILHSAIQKHSGNTELHYCFGRHRNEVYMAVVYLKKNGLCEPRSCYRVDNVFDRKRYEDFEHGSPRGTIH